MKQNEFSAMKNQIAKLKHYQLKELRDAINLELNSTNFNALVLTSEECDMIRALFLNSNSAGNYSQSI